VPKLFLCGDVMTGRGIDQVLAHPSDPTLYEDYVRDAREYVRLAEETNGPIPRGADPGYIWGEALQELEKADPAARIINLETAVTTSDEYWKGKGINYRMHPANVPVIQAARPDVCVLANNHVLDYGDTGLRETIDTLHRAGLKTAGAGSSLAEAARPATIDLKNGTSLVVFAFGLPTSGIPREWAATIDRPGVNYLADLSAATSSAVCDRIGQARRSSRILVVSIHWGGNWGYDVPREHVDFARALIAAGASIVYGHSSHHVRPIEVHRGRLILYGCGDFLTDYEGIGQQPGFRDDLVVMYLPVVDEGSGALSSMVLVPLHLKKFRLGRPSSRDGVWLRETLDRISKPFGTRVGAADERHWTIRWH
jgi:poly-gamma-glutamate synthesis protein (capsule biosynthesis protein)